MVLERDGDKRRQRKKRQQQRLRNNLSLKKKDKVGEIQRRQEGRQMERTERTKR